jgi:hypothetical protein
MYGLTLGFDGFRADLDLLRPHGCRQGNSDIEQTVMGARLRRAKKGDIPRSVATEATADVLRIVEAREGGSPEQTKAAVSKRGERVDHFDASLNQQGYDAQLTFHPPECGAGIQDGRTNYA